MRDKISALVVDDSPMDNHLLKVLLSRNLGCEVVTAENGLEALSMPSDPIRKPPNFRW